MIVAGSLLNQPRLAAGGNKREAGKNFGSLKASKVCA
jgi:hypothetical protein